MPIMVVLEFSRVILSLVKIKEAPDDYTFDLWVQISAAKLTSNAMLFQQSNLVKAIHLAGQNR